MSRSYSKTQKATKSRTSVCGITDTDPAWLKSEPPGRARKESTPKRPRPRRRMCNSALGRHHDINPLRKKQQTSSDPNLEHRPLTRSQNRKPAKPHGNGNPELKPSKKMRPRTRKTPEPKIQPSNTKTPKPQTYILPGPKLNPKIL